MSGGGDPSEIPKKQRALRATTADRLEAIVEAAERAAESVIDDAEAQARRYLAQAQEEANRRAGTRIADLAELIDSLLAQAGSLRQQAERLQATLEEASSRLETGEGAPPEQPAEADPELPDRPEPPRLRAIPGEAPSAGEEGRRPDPSGARLLATQMAVEGRSREEIEERLRNGFEIEDANAILDAILGPEEH